MSLEGKVALVTGGSGGLGRMHGIVLARKGADVALTANKNMEKAGAVADEIRVLGRKAIPIKIDISDEKEVAEGFAEVKEKLGAVDILINNAASGIVRAVPIVKMKREDWDRDVSINLTGAFNCIKAAFPDMIRKKWGRIINVSSVTGTLGGYGQCSYAATKAAMIGLSKTAALEGVRHNITSNTIILGVFDGGSFYDVAEPFRERIINRVAMRRAGNPEELSNVVAFLASGESNYITGAEIVVSGGIDLFTF